MNHQRPSNVSFKFPLVRTWFNDCKKQLSLLKWEGKLIIGFIWFVGLVPRGEWTCAGDGLLYPYAHPGRGTVSLLKGPGRVQEPWSRPAAVLGTRSVSKYKSIHSGDWGGRCWLFLLIAISAGISLDLIIVAAADLVLVVWSWLTPLQGRWMGL